MTFYADLSGTDVHADLALALRIEGIPVAFVERAIPVAPALAGYTQFVGITRAEEGEAELDFDERRELGATLDLDLLDDDAATLAALFAVNTRRRTWITADAIAAATSLSVQSTTGLVGGQTVYTDNETITIGTVASSTSLTGCTRGAFGSTAKPLYGTTPDGNPIYTVPPAWVGRRAYLYGYALTADGRSDEQLLGVWIVDEPPRCTGDGFWSLRFASVAQEIYERSIGVGLREAKVIETVTYGTSGGRPTATFTVDDSTGFRLGLAYPTYVIVRFPDDEGRPLYNICELQAVVLPPGTQSITVYADGTPWANTEPLSADPIGNLIRRTLRSLATTVRPLAFVGSSPQDLLFVLMSNEGQGATSYDRLPGRAVSSVYGSSWRFGAALSAAEVDLTAWAAILDSHVATIIVDKEQKLSDVLREWCLINGMALRMTSDGKLAPFTLSPERAGSATSIGPNDVIPDSRIELQADESALAPLATVKIGYNPLSGDYTGEMNLIDESLARRYPRSLERREIEFRLIGCSDTVILDPAAPDFRHPASLSAGDIGALAVDILRGDNGLARRFVSLSLTMAHLDLRIGDVVTLSASLPSAFSSLPDLRGSTLAGKTARVVARRPRYDAGRVDVRLLILDPLLVVCPAATITAIAGTTLTLATLTEEVSGTTPANDFFVNAHVRIYDVSTGATHNTTIASITSGTQLVVAAAPPFAVQTNVDYIVLDPAACTVPGTSVAGYSLGEFAAVAGDDGIVNISSGATTREPRWR